MLSSDETGSDKGAMTVTQIPEPAKKLLKGKNFASLATVMSDGSPQVTLTWIAHEGDTLLVNTVEGRLKHRNMVRDGRVAITVPDSDNPYSVLVVRGRVSGMTTEGADEQIDALAQRYMGVDKYPLNAPGDVRVIVKIEPEKVSYTGE